ncbi:hypothetical protein C9994_09675, partial [Marivirga lumbricoides]
RLIAIILNGLAKALGPVLNFVVEAIRVILGIFLLLFGLISGVSIVVATLVSKGFLVNSDYFHFNDFPYEVISNTIPAELAIAVVILLLIPAIFIIISGVSVLAKRWVLNKTVGFSMLAVWVIGIVLSAILIPATILKFDERGTYSEVKTFKIGEGKTAFLKVNEIGYEEFKYSSLTLKGYDGNEFKLEKDFRSQGSSRMDAEENAKMITHDAVLEQDSVLVIDSHFKFKKDALFRGQQLKMTLYIPYNQPFQMDRDMQYLLRNTIYINGYNTRQIPYNTWMFNSEGLQCLTCDEKQSKAPAVVDNYFYRTPFEISGEMNPEIYSFDNFDEISGGTGLFLEIHQGDEYKVAVFSDEDNLEDLEIINDNGKLDISYNVDNWGWRNTVPDIKCVITVPSLEKISLSSGAIAHLIDFKEDDLRIELNSAGSLYAKGSFGNLRVELSSAAKAVLAGKANYLNADASSAAQLEAFDLLVSRANIDVSSTAKAEVNVEESLDADASSAGRINYKGSPDLNSNNSSGGSVKRE